MCRTEYGHQRHNKKRKYTNIDGTGIHPIMYYDNDGIKPKGSLWKLNTEDDTSKSVYQMPAPVGQEVPWYLGAYLDLELLGKNWECTADVSLIAYTPFSFFLF